MKKIHGMRNTKEFRSWCEMRQRCHNPNNDKFHHYGARGIKVCSLWIDSFLEFYAYMGPKPSPKHSLDRIDVNGHYEPGNVRWATQKEQMRNTRKTRYATINGQRKPLIEWAELSGVKYATLWERYKQGTRGAALLLNKEDYATHRAEMNLTR